MTVDHHGRMAGKATLLVRVVDEILGTHRIPVRIPRHLGEQREHKRKSTLALMRGEDFVVPRIGTITWWSKNEGERVKANEPLLTVQIDKYKFEIPSPAAGILRRIAVAKNGTLRLGDQVAIIEPDPAGRSGQTG